MVQSMLIDQRNWLDMKDQLIAETSQADYVGFDIETHDAGRHQGLTDFMKATKKLVFDTNRTTICGFSIYTPGSDTAYYFNLAHADVENRLEWLDVKPLLDSKKPEAWWVAHNAPFELVMMKKSLGFEMPNIICTLQMAVSHHNEDQYPVKDMLSAGFGGMASLFDRIGASFSQVDSELNAEQQDLLGKVIAKDSRAAHSYNGLVQGISYGYGLKTLVKQIFGYDQMSFKNVLSSKAHMGELTGDEVAAYGADDAYWTYELSQWFMPRMAKQNDKLLTTFFEQENPMVHVFADIWGQGIRLDENQVRIKREEERVKYANVVRLLQVKIKSMLPFKEDLNRELEVDTWYKNNGHSYRQRITQWANLDLSQDDYTAVRTTSGAVSNAWGMDKKQGKSMGPNLTHYMMLRTILYDLADMDIIILKGKVQSDSSAREQLRKRGKHELLDLLGQLSTIEQVMKLYLTSYLQLIDPDTSRVYPVVSSKLNSRRMAMSTPNGMQLAKRGDSTYVRGFYLADEDDHVIVSIDWSQVELVEIGDFSKDPEFAKAFGQLPYNDLHKKAVADLMDITIAEVTKQLRGDVGKVANFNYWYSGALSTVGQNLGWSSDKMWDMTDKYRTTFAVAEKWRTDLIEEARDNGYITLPDGHRRVKYEASYEWRRLWKDRFDRTKHTSLKNFAPFMIKAITNRAGNQIVNSMIQGSCATLAKRSILSINELYNQFRFRFMMPIHDELVFSVHRDDAVEFIKEAKKRMCDHPDIIQHLVLDATASIGRNFEPYHPKKAPFGQVELNEAPKLAGWLADDTYDTILSDANIARVIQYLFQEQDYATTAAQ